MKPNSQAILMILIGAFVAFACNNATNGSDGISDAEYAIYNTMLEPHYGNLDLPELRLDTIYIKDKTIQPLITKSYTISGCVNTWFAFGDSSLLDTASPSKTKQDNRGLELSADDLFTHLGKNYSGYDWKTLLSSLQQANTDHFSIDPSRIVLSIPHRVLTDSAHMVVYQIDTTFHHENSLAISLSRMGFDSSKTHALVYFSKEITSRPNTEPGPGGYKLFERTDGSWACVLEVSYVAIR